jgi:hypothetical protein
MDWNTVSSLLWLLAFGAFFFFMACLEECDCDAERYAQSARDPQSSDADLTAHRHHAGY